MKSPKDLPEHLAPIWAEIEKQVYPEIGVVGLESLCIQVHRMRDARERIDKEGTVVADVKGLAVQHPAIAIEKAAGAEIRQWLGKFGKKGR